LEFFTRPTRVQWNLFGANPWTGGPRVPVDPSSGYSSLPALALVRQDIPTQFGLSAARGYPDTGRLPAWSLANRRSGGAMCWPRSGVGCI